MLRPIAINLPHPVQVQRQHRNVKRINLVASAHLFNMMQTFYAQAKSAFIRPKWTAGKRAKACPMWISRLRYQDGKQMKIHRRAFIGIFFLLAGLSLMAAAETTGEAQTGTFPFYKYAARYDVW